MVPIIQAVVELELRAIEESRLNQSIQLQYHVVLLPYNSDTFCMPLLIVRGLTNFMYFAWPRAVPVRRIAHLYTQSRWSYRRLASYLFIVISGCARALKPFCKQPILSSPARLRQRATDLPSRIRTLSGRVRCHHP